MRIYDCFLYNNEDIVLKLRLNILNPYVDKFIIVESTFTHSGNKKKLSFNINKFKKFKKKICYLICNKDPVVQSNFNQKKYSPIEIKIWKAIKRENYQRNFIINGLKKCHSDDIIIISDVDEIPNLSKVNFQNLRSKIVIFQQYFFYYKFNLYNPKQIWHGSRLCKFNNLKSPQWLRNIKGKKYSFLRFDIFFSEKKFNDIEIVKDGGWHFSYLMKPKNIEIKLRNYLHHPEIDSNNLTLDEIKKIVKKKKIIYDLLKDQRSNKKLKSNKKLSFFDHRKLPTYLFNNQIKYKKWFEKV